MNLEKRGIEPEEILVAVDINSGILAKVRFFLIVPSKL